MKVKKMFRKSLVILMAVSLLVQLIGVSFATERRTDSYVDVVVDGNIDKEKAQLIIDTINGEDVVAPRSILCVFGHSLAQGTALETTHRYYSATPRCRQVTYRVNYCTRSSCNYITYTVIGENRIHCCA